MSVDAAAKALKERVFKAMPDIVYGMGKAITSIVGPGPKKEEPQTPQESDVAKNP